MESEESNISIAPGERQRPVLVLNFEELERPHPLANDKFGYKVERDITLFPSKSFNQCFLNYTRQFS